ncbi:hypothetical protein Trydic_g23671 [Trypoxylus dichotomus]
MDVDANVMLVARNFLNKVAENPWNHCAPYTSPCLQHHKRYICERLDYNALKHFRKNFVLDILLKPALGEICLKSKRWREVYGLFCVNPQQTIMENDLKYIHECIHEMSPYGVISLLEKLNQLLVIDEQPENHGSSTNVSSPNGPRTLTYYQGETLFLNAPSNPSANMKRSIANLPDSLHVQNSPRSEEGVNRYLSNSNVLTIGNSTVVRENGIDQFSLFKQPASYPVISDENLNGKGGKIPISIKQENLMRLYQPIRPKTASYSTFKEPQQIGVNKTYSKVHRVHLQKQSHKNLKSLMRLGNFEINENGDIVFLDCKIEANLK